MSNSSNQPGIIANFKYLDEFCDAIRSIRQRDDFSGFEALSPTSYHEIEEASGFGPSPVRFFTLIGALTGMSTGLALCLYFDIDWPLVVGGKTPGFYSFPAFVVIMFEMTILFGALATIGGMLWHCRLANPFARILEPRTTDDLFTIFVPNVGSDSQQAQTLKGFGAFEIKKID